MHEFDHFPLLYVKEWLLLIAVAVTGAGVRLAVGEDRQPARERLGDVFLSLPFGLGILLAIGWLAVRLSLLLRLPSPFRVSVVAILATIMCAAVVCARFLLRTWPEAGWRSWTTSLAGLGLLGVVGVVPLLPLLYSKDVVFFAGVGTDSTGYIRAAKSMTEGWYFQPVPPITLADTLRYPDRGWTYWLMMLRDRPIAHYLIAVLSSLTRTNPFQAYLMSGSLAPIVLSSFLMFLVLSLCRGAVWIRLLLLLPSAALTTLAGLTGNFFHQFVGHVWSVVSVVVLAPAIYVVCLRRSSAPWSLGFATFIPSFIVMGIYDLRFAVLVPAAAVGARLVGSRGLRIRTILADAFFAIVGLLAAAALGGHLSALASVFRRFNVNQFPEQRFSVDFFFYQAAMVADDRWPKPLLIVLGTVVLLGTIVLWRRTRLDHQPEVDPGIPFVSNYVSVVLIGTVAGTCLLLWTGNDWAAHKMLYWAAAAAVIAGTLLLIDSANHARYLRTGALGALIVLCAAGSIRATTAMADRFVRGGPDYGVIRAPDFLRFAARLRSVGPEVVWFDGDVLDSLVFLAYFGEGAWITLEPYRLWYDGGAGIYARFSMISDSKLLSVPGEPPEFGLSAVYQESVSRPEVRRADWIAAVSTHGRRPQPDWCSGPYCITMISPAELHERSKNSTPSRFVP